MIRYIGIFLFSVFISSISQIILKKCAGKEYDSKLKEYLNVPVILAYGIFFLSTLITMIAYRYVPLSLGPILESSGYIFVTILGAIFLKEKITRRKLMGLSLILVGILVFNLG